MEKSDSQESGAIPGPWLAGNRLRYEEQMRTVHAVFSAHVQHLNAGGAAVEARSAAVDNLVQAVWNEVQAGAASLAAGISLVAVGGYGRRELFPYSDVDLMFLLDSRLPERRVKEPIRRVNQMLWDAGLRVSAMTRTLTECERFTADNVEFTLALLDARLLAGDPSLAGRLVEKSLPRLVARDAKKIAARLLEATRTRHARFGSTLFHLEPNIKEYPGGLRDVHVCEWLGRLSRDGDDSARELRLNPAFREAREYLTLVRVFLHFRHGRDDNTLDWQAQDEAAALSLGSRRRAGGAEASQPLDAAYWMRMYFRHARAIERCVRVYLDEPAAPTKRPPAGAAFQATAASDFVVKQNRIVFTVEAAVQEPRSEDDAGHDPAHDPEIVLKVFEAMATSGAKLSQDAERRIENALPVLSAHLEDGLDLWWRMRSILLGSFAGTALRMMHALGILELVIPEFHGIDALVIRDAYHRYTVDEHTFVLIDTLHALGRQGGENEKKNTGSLQAWTGRFAGLFRDLPHPELLLLGSLLHDTGKGHAGPGHAAESARMAANVMRRLELDVHEARMVHGLILNHLEMSAALRRDVFDQETIRSFAECVPTPESLRMLTLFTYADITAVHPDALTPWKAENLWRLYQATAKYLDRNVDDERVATEPDEGLAELVLRIHALLPNFKSQVNAYLEGFPQRYLQTRTPEVVRAHMEMASRLKTAGAVELEWHNLPGSSAPGLSELTLITHDRPRLFASIAGALAAWGLNIITADAFSNAHGIVVDSFRFTDTFRTLELNESERERFVASVRGVLTGQVDLESLLAARRRGRRKLPKTRVEARIDFDPGASSHSTLLQVVAQDTPGLLRALSLTLAEHQCNIEVALVDTEGETAIDVFYLTQSGGKLDDVAQETLRASLLKAIEQNAR
jgi:[protein-PII] uridylyltransferase